MGEAGTTDAAARINLVHTKSKNYSGVQQQILGAITRHLAPGEFSTTVGKRTPGSLNFSLFILQPSDVVMSHGLADKNYFLRKDREGERISNRLEHLFVPGEWLKRRLLAWKGLEVDAERIHVVGWPRLDALLATQQEMPVVPREPGARPKVLWAPTHDYARRGKKKDSMSSYPELLEYLPMFEKHFDLLGVTSSAQPQEQAADPAQPARLRLRHLRFRHDRVRGVGAGQAGDLSALADRRPDQAPSRPVGRGVHLP